MNRIMVKELMADGSYPKAGAILFLKANVILSKNDKVTLDMTDIESIPTTFMNTSFGELINLFGIEKTKQSFEFRNVSRSQIERIRKYFNDYEKL